MFFVDIDTFMKEVWLLKEQDMLLNPNIATSCFILLSMLLLFVPEDSILALPFGRIRLSS